MSASFTEAPAAAPQCPACGHPATATNAPGSVALLPRRVRRREPLYRAGDPLEALYVVRSGTFKSVLPMRDGNEQVTGFHLAGDALGLDAVAEGRHVTTAVALEDSEVAVLSYAQLRDVAGGGTGLHDAIARLMSGEIVREHRLLALRTFSAHEKVAAFLLNLSRHMRMRGYSPSDFHLRMTRAEIGSYLSLQLETVSRVFSDLQRRGVVTADGRNVHIADMQALKATFSTRTT